MITTYMHVYHIELLRWFSLSVTIGMPYGIILSGPNLFILIDVMRCVLNRQGVLYLIHKRLLVSLLNQHFRWWTPNIPLNLSPSLTYDLASQWENILQVISCSAIQWKWILMPCRCRYFTVKYEYVWHFMGLFYWKSLPRAIVSLTHGLYGQIITTHRKQWMLLLISALLNCVNMPLIMY